MQAFPKRIATAAGDHSRFLQSHFAMEIGELIFSEMAVNEIEGLFGDAQVFRIGRVEPEPVARRIHEEPLRRNAEKIQTYSYLGQFKTRKNLFSSLVYNSESKAQGFQIRAFVTVFR